MVHRFIIKKPHKGYSATLPSKRIGVVNKKRQQMKKMQVGSTSNKIQQILPENSCGKESYEVNTEATVNEIVETNVGENKIENIIINKMNEETIEQINSILSDETDVKKPKRKTKIEKRENGLIERTEDSVVLITEDNKTLLTD